MGLLLPLARRHLSPPVREAVDSIPEPGGSLLFPCVLLLQAVRSAWSKRERGIMGALNRSSSYLHDLFQDLCRASRTALQSPPSLLGGIYRRAMSALPFCHSCILGRASGLLLFLLCRRLCISSCHDPACMVC